MENNLYTRQHSNNDATSRWGHVFSSSEQISSYQSVILWVQTLLLFKLIAITWCWLTKQITTDFFFDLPLFSHVNALYIYIYIYIYILDLPDIGQGVRVFANRPGDRGSIPGRVIPKTQKMVLDTSLLNTQHYKVRIKGKVEQSREGVAPSPTPWCSSYRKGSLRVTLDYRRQLYLYIYLILKLFFNFDDVKKIDTTICK